MQWIFTSELRAFTRKWVILKSNCIKVNIPFILTSQALLIHSVYLLNIYHLDLAKSNSNLLNYFISIIFLFKVQYLINTTAVFHLNEMIHLIFNLFLLRNIENNFVNLKRNCFNFHPLAQNIQSSKPLMSIFQMFWTYCTETKFLIWNLWT